MSKSPASRAWSWRHAVTKSDLPPTTRHVLLTLSVFMDETGRGCYPSIDDLVAASGLSKRAVLTHLEKACAAGWVTRRQHGYRGQKWRRLEYEAGWPERDVDLPQDVDGEDREQPQEGGERAASPSKTKAVQHVPEGGERRAPKLVNDVHQDRDQSNHHSKTSPDSREGARAQGQKPEPTSKPRINLKPIVDGDVEETLAALVRIWPPGAVGNMGKARGLLADMTPDQRKREIAAAPRYLRALKDEKRRYVPAIETYLANGDSERFPEPKGGTAEEPQIELKPYVAELWAMLWRGVADGKPDAVAYGLDRIGKGLTTLVRAVPPADEVKALVPIRIGSPEHEAWQTWCQRMGFRMPRPDHVPVVYVPSKEPPVLNMRWKGYHLAAHFDCQYRDAAWWWRVYVENAPIADLIADRSVGNCRITMGPIPLREEIAAMVRIDVEDETWPAWELWFARKRVRLLPLGGYIYAPARHPNEAFPPVRDAVPDWETLEAMGETR